jgi:hypothetical protein
MSSKLVASETPGSVQEEPVYCLNGDRHREGVTLILALIRNVRTCRFDAKGEA